jgi:hypothetical protein
VSLRKIDVLLAGQRVTVRGHLFDGWAARCGFYGWSIHRMPDGTEIVKGLDREVALLACERLQTASKRRVLKLEDVQHVMREFLGVFIV